MALSKTITINSVEVKDAYIRVSGFRGDKKDISFVVSYHANVDSVPFHSEGFSAVSYDMEGSNPIKQAYEYLKTLPEFSGATDC